MAPYLWKLGPRPFRKGIMGREPRVTIGLPVFNGENYLGLAIDSLLKQTFEDFELIICDNASTDGTEEICRSVVGDPRVRYVRQASNLGATANYNHAFSLGTAPLFRWAAHDDLWRPTHLEKSVEAFDAHPEAVLTYTGTIDIDPEGNEIREWDPMPGYESSDPADRFEAALTMKETFPIFALMRRDVLIGTQLHPWYAGSDRALIAEMALLGPFVEVRELLFLHRQHPQRSIRTARNRRERLMWWDPNRVDRLILPHSLLIRDYIRAVRKAPLTSAERRQCWRLIAADVWRRRTALAVDAGGALRYWISTRVRAQGRRS